MESNTNWLVNPEIFQFNKLEPHSDHLFFETLEAAEKLEEIELKQSLNGEWKFLLAKNPTEREKDFYKENFSASNFKTITVPGHIQMQNFDKLQYINTLYPWDGKERLRPPFISMEDNPVGSYIKEFELDSRFFNKDIFISFQGVETAFFLWINGEFVGYSEDSFTPAEFEITKFLKEGKNKVAVEVYKRSSASWIEDQDFWRFSGIFREVFIYATPKLHIKDLFVKTELKNNYKDAELKLICLLNSKDPKGKIWAKVISQEKIEILQTEKIQLQNELEIRFSLNNIKLWSAEEPNLYKVFLILEDENNEIIEVIPQTIGLREFKLENGLMLLNGKRIVFKGVNRHEFSHKKGRAISKEEMLWDIKFMKTHNINAVRTSHYPNQSLWYKLCDKYGIYLIDETNLESHGSWQKMGTCEPSWNVPGNKPEWKECVLARAKAMLERDKNHPSILIWSCGNESYAEENIFNMTKFFHERDNSRLVHYEGCFWNREFDKISDMESRMYAKAKDIITYLESNPDKPYISCEYMHAMGNSCGGLMKYTELEEKYEKYQGGFIWDYIDQAIEVEKDGKKVLLYGGDFMDRPTDYNFCGNGIVFADRTITPKALEVKYLYQNVKISPNETGCLIKNRNLFENLSNYEFIYTIEKEEKVLQEGRFEVICNPNEDIQIEIPWFKNITGVYSKNIRMILKEDQLWAKKGFEVAYGQEIKVEKENQTHSEYDFKVVEGDGNIGVFINDTEVLFAKDKGLVSLVYQKNEMLIERPQPVFWRAATDNDKGYAHPQMCSIWLGASIYQNVKLLNWEANENFFKIDYIHQVLTIPNLEVKVSYLVDKSERIKVTLEYTGIENLPELPTLAMRFKIPNNLNQFKYYGKGPHENYIDRNEGARLGVYIDFVKNNVTPYLVPQECGNRTNTIWGEVFENATNKIKFIAEENKSFEFQVLPHSFLELEEAKHQYELGNYNYTYITIAMKQMGIGGDDSWGAPVLEEYCIPSNKDYKFSFYITK